VPMKIADNAKTFERRFYPRTPYSGHIFFASKDRFFEGKLINFSRYGLYIKTSEALDLEEVLTIALPFSDGRQCKCKGQVVWCNHAGIGVELFKKRTAAGLRIIK